MVAVSNTSPLVLLDKAGYLWILEKLFKKVIIPPAVDMEWLRPGGYVVPQWLSVATLSQDALATVKDLSRKIDKGEAESISLFSSIKADWLLLDDLNARTIAKAMGFPVVGVLGILITAKRKKIIPEITTVLEALKQHRFYVSDEILQKALVLANETKK